MAKKLQQAGGLIQRQRMGTGWYISIVTLLLQHIARIVSD